MPVNQTSTTSDLFSCRLFLHTFLMSSISFILSLILCGCSEEPQVNLYAISDIYSIRPDGSIQELADGNAGEFTVKNQHWDLETQTIRLVGARNEEVAVQIIVADTGIYSANVETFTGAGSIDNDKITLSTVAWVNHEKTGMVPDLVLPLTGKIDQIRELTIPFQISNLPDANNTVGIFLLEIWIPADASPGTYQSALILQKNQRNYATLPIELSVFDFTLPNQPTFAFELLSYGMPSKAIDRSAVINHTKNGKIAANPLAPELLAFNHQVYKLALDNRCFVNALPYSSQRGNADFALPVTGRGESAYISGFEAWEQLFEPILAGKLSKFGSVPAHVFLPFNINYPYISESEPAKQFDFTLYKENISEKPGQLAALAEFESTYKTIARQYRAYFAGKGWKTPRFEIFNNQKINPQRNRSPWKLDEPVVEADYRGLRYLFNLSREAFAPWREDGLHFVNRLDIGHFNCDKLQSEAGEPATCYKKKGFNRDNADQYLKSLVDHWVVGSTHAEAADHLFEEYNRTGVKFINYSTSGSAAGIGGHFGQFAGEGFRAFRMGLKGRVIFKLGLIHGDPDQVSANPYRGPSIYKGQPLGYDGALASRRLKMWRRAVNDYDYLQLAYQKNPEATERLIKSMITAGESHDPKYAERSGIRGYWINNNIEDFSRAKTILAAIIAGTTKPTTISGPDDQYIPCASGDRIGGYD